ncbi:hypothetical protein DPMN_062662 [Dreissena polymorpha]|uniref:Secreted protein n=1 Tax=Dreissena polymorpha TaxID=45954 RepID=A0A9D4CA72_DREPO|nr:hypothetical protein DPMN_062662 [Dreissena polymorpha]
MINHFWSLAYFFQFTRAVSVVHAAGNRLNVGVRAPEMVKEKLLFGVNPTHASYFLALLNFFSARIDDWKENEISPQKTPAFYTTSMVAVWSPGSRRAVAVRSLRGRHGRNKITVRTPRTPLRRRMVGFGSRKDAVRTR